MNLYPFQFEPILKERIWGGQKLKNLFNKGVSDENIGESWEISTVQGDVSTIKNGSFAGKSLQDVIDENPESVLGTSVFERFGKQFPLLFKFLDAREALSIQVHPNDELAQKRHNSFGKTEMWYVMQADVDAKLIVGFKENCSSEIYLENLENKTLLSILNEVEAKQGDVFFLETGTVHAIGAGLIIAEIQQTSDITYRLYDFDRKDANGNERELHIDLALDAINYKQTNTQKQYEIASDKSKNIVDCPYFTTNFIALENSISFEKSGNSFTVLMCVDGEFDLKYSDSQTKLKKGDTILIPAALKSFVLQGNATVLEIYIR